MARPILRGLFVVMSVGSLLAASAAAADPFHVQVDRLIAESPLGLVAEPAGDGEFLRRLSLVLTGRVPSSAQARAFLDDKSPTKRASAIDRLLASPEYVRRMTNMFDVMLSERRGDGEVKRGEWSAYLKASIAANKPWNLMAAEILGSDAVDAKNRGPAKFLMDRGVEVNLMTREVGRMFFGMDLQCAQCHNHPLIDDYRQEEYYGIYAFLNRTYLFKPDKKKPGVLAEKPTGNVSFKSVFTGDSSSTRPRLPGDRQIDEPAIKAGEEYKVKPDKKKKNLRPIPSYSRREQLARLIRGGKNRAFARNMVNRLWLHVMGRGLVEPVDFHHSDNPPSHPELLEALVDQFVATKFDIRSFVRELALTRTFARSVDLPTDLVARSEKASVTLEAAKKHHAKAEAQLAAIDKQVEMAEAVQSKAAEAVAPIAAELKKADTALAAAKKAAAPPAKALADATKKLTDKQKVSSPLIAAALQAVAAAKLLPADKELAALAAKLDGRGKAMAAEVTAIKKDVAAKQAVATTTDKKLKAAETSRAGILKRHDAAAQIVETASRKLADQRAIRRGNNVQLTVALHRKETLELLASFAARQKAVVASRAVLATADKALAPVSAKHKRLNAALVSARKELVTAETDRQKTAAALVTTQQKISKLPTVTQSLGEAASKAATALAALGNDKELAGITKTLQGRSAGLNKELADAKKVLPGQKSAATAAVTRAGKAKQSLTQATTAMTGVNKQRAPLLATANAARAKAEAAGGSLDETAAELSKAWSKQFAIGTIESLTPEELGWSVLEATGMIARQRQTVVAELNKKSPLKPADKKDSAKVLARKNQVEQTVFDKLKGSVGTFVSLYGAAAAQPQDDFFSTVDQALFMANGGEVKGWLTPGGGNLTDRLVKMTEDRKLAEELYLSVLTRRPTDDEVGELADYLKERGKKQRTEAIQEVTWALLTSAEFRFNH